MASIYVNSPDQNHLVSAYNQEQAYRMFFDGDGLGLTHVFEGCSDLRNDRHGDHLLLYAPTGDKKIYFKGGGKANSVGAITGMSIGTIVFLEFNLLHRDFIRECFRRTFAAKQRYHLAEQNPPAPNHPNLEDIERFRKAGTYRFRHWRPHDNPALTEERKAELKAELIQSDYLYKRDWLGERVMPVGAIYSNFDKDIHIIKQSQMKGRVVEAFFVADGGQGDATSCGFYLVTYEKEDGQYRLYRMANYYHSGTDTGIVKAMSIYAKELKVFVEWCYNKWEEPFKKKGEVLPRWSYFFVDPACKALREELHLEGIITDGADNNSRDKVTSNGTKIEVGIERMRSALTKGAFFLVDPGNEYDHYHFVKEVGMYIRNDAGYPIDKHNHCLDEARYAINYFARNYLL